MQPQTLERRVERLETRMTALEELPAKVDTLGSQVSQLGDEMRREFTAIRGEIRAGDEETQKTLGQLIDKRFDEAKRHALVLHEAVIEQIKVMGEGDTGRRRPPRKRR